MRLKNPLIFLALTLFAVSLSISAAVPDDELIHLHIIPHTHNDAGWLFTVDSYFHGDNSRGCVECILNNITYALQANPDRKFVYVEQIFFQAWWKEISEESRAIVLELINNGQLDFLLAGYVMNDEACSYYDDIIEQMTLGHRFVKATFNRTVNVGWHIDPFGHSAAQARLFSEMGFDSWFFERIDFQDYNQRIAESTLETIWRPQSYDTDTNFLMAHVNFMSYYLAPFNWCIDMLCYPQPSMPEVVRRALKYADWVKNQSSSYKSKHIMHHVGGDFEWSGNAELHYLGLETLIDFLNGHPELGIKAYFSTPSNYTSSLYEEVREKNITFTEKTDDFFPYQDVPHAYWTGYFTSKSSMKGNIRDASKFLQGSRKLLTRFFFQGKVSYEELDQALYGLEHAVSMLQHHDAVTGTAKHAVDINYINILMSGYVGIYNSLLPKVQQWYNNLFKGQDQVAEFMVCISNATSCSVTYEAFVDGKHVAAVVYNPSQISTRLVKVQVPNVPLSVYDQWGSKISHDILCEPQDVFVIVEAARSTYPLLSERLFVYTLNVPDFTNHIDVCHLYFLTESPTNDLQAYSIVRDSSYGSNMQVSCETLNKDKDQWIDLFNEERLFISSGFKSFEYVMANGTTYDFQLDYRFYVSYEGADQNSGAYIFRPVSNDSVEYSSIEQVTVKNGKEVIELKIQRTDVITKIRFYKNVRNQTIEIETMLKPVSISDSLGKELTLNIKTKGIQNRGVFYTDANGLEMQKRILNYRPTYNVSILEPISANYYPVNSAIYIADSESGERMTLMNDRSQGGSSLTEGSIEVMIHRRVLKDDNRGVDEPLSELDDNGQGISVQMTHWLFFSKGPQKQRSLQYDLDTPPQLYVAQSSNTNRKESELLRSETKVEFNEVKLYVRPYGKKELLVRLHNVHESQNKSISFWEPDTKTCAALRELLGDNYSEVKIKEIEEVTLDTVQKKEDMLKKKFSWDGKYKYEAKEDNFENILLRSLEERVFMLKLDD